MSDTINTLNRIVGIAAKRAGDAELKDCGPEDLAAHRLELLEHIVEAAGDCLEEHKAASLRAKPRKQRVYKDIVEQIAVLFCDQVDTHEGAFFIEENVRDILRAFHIETKDFEGNEVKI